MILSFRGRATRLVWEGQYSRSLPSDVQAPALRKLRLLNEAVGLTSEPRMSKSSTIMRSRSKPAPIANPHPGEILFEEFLKPLGLSQNALARAIGVPPRRINEIVLGKRAVTADTALRLARYFSVSDGMFLGMQLQYDLMEQRRRLGRRLAAIRPRAA